MRMSHLGSAENALPRSPSRASYKIPSWPLASSFSLDLPNTNVLHPSSFSRSAMARPIPCVPPLTSADLPLSPRSILLFAPAVWPYVEPSQPQHFPVERNQRGRTRLTREPTGFRTRLVEDHRSRE